MIIKNVGARAYTVNGGILAPGQTLDVSDEQGEALIKAGRHVYRDGGQIVRTVDEIVAGDPPMPDAKPFGTVTLTEDKALDLISKLPADKLDSITTGDERPEVLSAVLRRKRSGPGR